MADAVEANLALARRGYEVWNTRGARAMVDEVYAPDVLYRDPPEFPDAAAFRGADTVAARLIEMVQAIGDIQMVVRSLEGRGEYLLAAVDARGEGVGSGLRVSTSIFHVFRCSGGQFSEVRAYLDADQARREYERLSTAPGG